MLVLDDSETKAAIVTLDTLGAWDEMVQLARARIEKLAGVPAAHIMVAASHNHSGPGFDAKSKWGRELIDKLGAAANQAASDMRAVTLGYVLRLTLVETVNLRLFETLRNAAGTSVSLRDARCGGLFTLVSGAGAMPAPVGILVAGVG
ncbi:MAG: hypothetical protein ACE5LU_22975 [Anaerolineae bacterium]